jgi:NADH-quinone oxidoreductase subunit G
MRAAMLTDYHARPICCFGVQPRVRSVASPVACGAARLEKAEFVVVMSGRSSRRKQFAEVRCFPVGPFTETAGTFVNCEGRGQSFARQRAAAR